MKQAKTNELSSSLKFSVFNKENCLNNHYKLRYNVYCLENDFLPPGDYPDGYEIDVFDKHSIHVGCTDRNDKLVAAFRLVLPSHHGFPLFKHCELFNEYKNLAAAKNFSAATTAELSRLAVMKAPQRLQNDKSQSLSTRNDQKNGIDNAVAAPHRRDRSKIVLGLYKVAYQTSKRQGITHWYAAMEDPLFRLLRRFNFTFTPIGPETDYFGPVTPYIAEIKEIEKKVFEQLPALYNDFIAGLESEFLPDIATVPSV